MDILTHSKPPRLYPYFRYSISPALVMALSVRISGAFKMYSVFHIIYIPALLSEMDFISRLLVHIETSH